MKNIFRNSVRNVIKAFFADPRVRLVCMAYARNAERVFFSSLAISMIALVGFIFLHSDSTDTEWVYTLKASLVFFTANIPAIPAIIIMDMENTYKLSLRSTQE